MRIAAVIPVHNRPDVLRRAIASIQAQSAPVSEIIVVDDASTDDTPAVVERLHEQDDRIRLVRQPERKGASAARNRGVGVAVAEWIAFLDSDDEWDLQKIERQQAGLARRPECSASFTGCWMIFDEELSVEHRLPADFSLLDLQKINLLSTTSTALVKRSELLAVGGFDETLPSCQDWNLWLRLRARGPFVTLPDPLVRFHQGRKDRISRNMASVLCGHEIVFGQIQAAITNPEDRRAVRAMHRARMSQIYLDDLNRPLTAFAYALGSRLLGRSELASKMIRLSWLGLKRKLRAAG